jgi:hypothetical protein
MEKLSKLKLYDLMGALKLWLITFYVKSFNASRNQLRSGENYILSFQIFFNFIFFFSFFKVP